MNPKNHWYEIVCHGAEENLHMVMNENFKVKDKAKERRYQLQPSRKAH